MKLQMSSASAQKKRHDDRNSKLVREISALPANKYCFECGLRGPTYVNITNGSFCCMHCSGLLRGLNPPHRVKSISISTFTNEEIEKLKSMGNEENARIWLGLHDGPVKFDSLRNNEAIKNHMIQKYEYRKWYVSPSEIAEQRQLLEAHKKDRTDSLSDVVSVHSQVSNMSAPANLAFPTAASVVAPAEKSAGGDILDLLEDLMVPIKEQPAAVTPVAPAQVPSAGFVPFDAPIPPLLTHKSTPAPLQFNAFPAPAQTSSVAFDPFSTTSSTATPSATDLFPSGDDFWGAPAMPAVASVLPTTGQSSQPARTLDDKFANFDSIFNTLTIDPKPTSAPGPNLVNGGFPTSAPLESVAPQPSLFSGHAVSAPLASTVLTPTPAVAKNDGPDYDALKAIYQDDENEPMDFFGFNSKQNTSSAPSQATANSSFSLSAGFTGGQSQSQSQHPATNGFAKSSSFATTDSGSGASHLTPNPFTSLNSFSTTTGPLSDIFPTGWPSTTSGPTHAATPTASSTTAAAGSWNPFS